MLIFSNRMVSLLMLMLTKYMMPILMIMLMLKLMLSDCTVSDVPNDADSWINPAHRHRRLPCQKVHTLQLHFVTALPQSQLPPITITSFAT